MQEISERPRPQTASSALVRHSDEARVRAVEEAQEALVRRVKRLEVAMLRRPGPEVALGFTDIDGPSCVEASVNDEQEVTFKVTEVLLGRDPLPDTEVTVTITGTTTGSIANAKAGSPKRQAVTTGTPLKIDSDADGKVTVFVLGTMVERFTVTGLVTSGTFQPSHSVTIKVT